VLKERVISAVVMLVVFIVVNFYFPDGLFRFSLSLLAAVAAWEWSRLAGVSEFQKQLICAGVMFLTTLVVLWLLPLSTLAPAAGLLSVLVWFAILFTLILQPTRQLPADAIDWKALLSGFGLLSLCVIFFELLHNRSLGGSPWLLVYVLSVVWVMDIGAYFSGKRFGKNKLAPLISPGKTQEGVLGGVACTAILALLTLLLSTFASDKALVFVVGTILAAIVSVVGDLFESRLKRAAGFKDSSNLIKGHGGILDRIDGVIAAIPVFGFAWAWL